MLAAISRAAQRHAPGGGSTASPTSDSPIPGVVRQPAPTLGPRAQRTVTRILEATREVFQRYGYAGTTIDEIGRVAKVSRASFYTYFPTKRDVLLAVGEQAALESLALFDGLRVLGRTRAGMREWVASYLAFLDVHGSFAFAWTQAAQDDAEIRAIGTQRHRRMATYIGEVLAGCAGRTTDDPRSMGLVAHAALERSWSYCTLLGDDVDREAVTDELAALLWAAGRA